MQLMALATAEFANEKPSPQLTENAQSINKRARETESFIDCNNAATFNKAKTPHEKNREINESKIMPIN